MNTKHTHISKLEEHKFFPKLYCITECTIMKISITFHLEPHLGTGTKFLLQLFTVTVIYMR